MKVTKWSSIEYVDGIVVTYVEGATFPFKTIPASPELQYATGIVKKTVIEFIRRQSFFTAIFFSFKLEQLLESFTRITDGVLNRFMYYKFLGKDFAIELTPISRGLGKLTELFFVNYGINQDTAHKVAELMAHVIEYDSFYRFKLLDLMAETTKERFTSNPRKEIQRLLKICYDREQVIPTYMRPKLKILSMLAWFFILPKAKRALQRALKEVDFKMFEIDETDRFWLLQRTDYYYFGKPLEERMKEFKEKGWSEPNYYTEEPNGELRTI